MDEPITVSVSQFVDLFNQTLEFAYPDIVIVGELANFRISRNKWVYFDLKDENSSIKFFGSVYRLPGPLEDGMVLKVRGQPRLHNLYGFSINFSGIQAAGEGSIRRAADLLRQKLASEGLFDEARKRALPYPPSRIGLITSEQSAAYADFNKIINERWRGLSIECINVQVQGEVAPAQIVLAIEEFNALAEPPEVLVIIRGGGSPEDLFAFSTEQVTRAVAASRIPTLVAIGHEIDLSLAELAADKRASTPSNAAELLVPDWKQVANEVNKLHSEINQIIKTNLSLNKLRVDAQAGQLNLFIEQIIGRSRSDIKSNRQLVEAFNPTRILSRGYAVVRSKSGQAIKSANQVGLKEQLMVQLDQGKLNVVVESKDN